MGIRKLYADLTLQDGSALTVGGPLTVNGGGTAIIAANGLIQSGVSLVCYSTAGNQLAFGYDTSNRLLMSVAASGVHTWSLSGASAGITITGGLFTIGTATTFAFTQSASLSSAIISRFINTNTGSAAHSNITIQSSEATGGSPSIQWGINNVVSWQAGINNADLDNWQLRYNSDHTLTGGTLVMSANSSGNVGIGTNSPGARLHVVGGRAVFTSLSTDFGGNLSAVVQNPNAANTYHLGVDSNGAFILSDVGGTIRLTLSQAGNLTAGPSNSTTLGQRMFVSTGELHVDYATGGGGSGPGGGALRLATNSNAAFVGGNEYFDGVSTGRRVRDGGVSEVLFDITTGSTAGDMIFQNEGTGVQGSPISLTERMRIKSNGSIVMNGSSTPSTANLTVFKVPSVFVYRSASQSHTTSGNWETISFPSGSAVERWDTDNMHDLSTNPSRINCPTPGKYRITAGVQFAANATGQRGLRLLRNGVSVMSDVVVDTAASGNTNLVITVEFDMQAGTDYAEIQAFQSSGGALNLEYNGHFTPHISATYIGG